MGLSEPEIAARLQNMDEYDFEKFIAELWAQIGWETQVTSKSKDSGIDVIATRSAPYPEKELIQAKRLSPSSAVTGPKIDQYAALHNHEPDVDKVVVVTTSRFTDSALSNADRSNVKTIDGAKLARIIIQLEASDLVEKYTSGVTQAEIERQSLRTGGAEKQSEESGSGSSRKSSISIESRSDILTIELVGIERVETEIGRSGFLRRSTELDGVMAAFKIFNRTQRTEYIESGEQIFAFDEEANRYPAVELNGVGFEDGWVAHDGDYVEMEQGSRLKYVVGFSMPSRAKVSSIDFHEFDISLDLDYEVRQNLPQLPEAVSFYLD